MSKLGKAMIKDSSSNGKKYWNFPKGKPSPNNYVWDGKGWIKNPTIKTTMVRGYFRKDGTKIKTWIQPHFKKVKK
ncbi:MAG TPA: hypothetical protein VMZ91_01535 [Candidatus Paceibacterota bacterium]|nr:hypothetical protein [Candidatus Paceibacterota bacterium]